MSINKILEIGVPLDSLGVKNWGLTKQQAIDAINKLLSLEIPILGGDVVEIRAGQFEYNYDNWHCDRVPDESHQSYAERSCLYARRYVEHYVAKNMEKILFVIVAEETETP